MGFFLFSHFCFFLLAYSPCCICAALSVFFISMAIVIGLTLHGTGVMKPGCNKYAPGG